MKSRYVRLVRYDFIPRYVVFKLLTYRAILPSLSVRVEWTNVDENLMANQLNFRAKYLQNGKEN